MRVGSGSLRSTGTKNNWGQNERDSQDGAAIRRRFTTSVSSVLSVVKIPAFSATSVGIQQVRHSRSGCGRRSIFRA